MKFVKILTLKTYNFKTKQKFKNSTVQSEQYDLENIQSKCQDNLKKNRQVIQNVVSKIYVLRKWPKTITKMLFVITIFASKNSILATKRVTPAIKLYILDI